MTAPAVAPEGASFEAIPSSVPAAAADAQTEIVPEAAVENTEGADGSAPGPAADADAVASEDSFDTAGVSPAQAEAIISVQAPSLAASEQLEALGASSEPSMPEPSAAMPEHSAASAPSREVATEEMIEVWRPGRRDEHHPRRPRERHAHGRRPQRQSEASPVAPAGNGAVATGEASESPPAAPSAIATSPTEPPPDSRRRRERRTDRREMPERAQQSDRPPHRQHAGRAERGNRDSFQRSGQHGDRPPRSDRADRQPRGDRPDRDPELREKYIKGRPGRPSRTRARSEFPFRQARGAERAARGEQGAALSQCLAWIASVSTSGFGTRGSCAPARQRRRSPPPATCGSMVSVSLPRAARFVRAMW